MKFTGFVANKVEPRFVVRRKMMDKLPDGRLYSTKEIAVVLKTTFRGLRTDYYGYEDYWVNHEGKKRWGNKRTIAAFKKELDKNERVGD